MVIDESSARASIKRNIRVFDRRLSAFDKKSCNKKSRKGWLKRSSQIIKKTSWVVDVIKRDEFHINYYVLAPYENHFESRIVTLNLKTMSANISVLNMIFTNHFIIRLMQYRKTMDLGALANDISWSMDVLFSLLEFIRENNHKSGDYRIYADQLGFIPAIYEKNDSDGEIVTVKTLIPPNVMGEKHWDNYSPLIGKELITMSRVEYHRYNNN